MEEIINILERMSGRYNYHMIFQDWVAVMAISIQNNCYLIHNNTWEEREKLYKNIMQKYTIEERQNFSKMFAMLADEFEKENIRDILGEIYMSKKSGNSRLGQFFTPFHISELCAKMSLHEQLHLFNENDVIEINEPSAGGGGMMIAAIKVLKENGINYQKKLDIVAQDLDWNGVYMTYVQLSLLGAKAIVVQGNTLGELYEKGKTPDNRIFYTPAKMWGGVL